MDPPFVLFICTYNSVRSQIAEGVCRMLHPNWKIFSAGTAKGHLSPHVVKILEENGCDTSTMSAKHLTDLSQSEFDLIVVLCEDAWMFREGFPNAKQMIFHPVNSPELCYGDDELLEYRRCFAGLKDFCEGILKSLG